MTRIARRIATITLAAAALATPSVANAGEIEIYSFSWGATSISAAPSAAAKDKETKEIQIESFSWGATRP